MMIIRYKHQHTSTAKQGSTYVKGTHNTETEENRKIKRDRDRLTETETEIDGKSLMMIR